MTTTAATKTVAEQTAAVTAGFANAPSAIREVLLQGKSEHIASFDSSKVPTAGTDLPSFELTNASNQPVTLESILSSADKGLLIVFYRGGWCPFCNIELRTLQAHLSEFTALGVKLVAVTPELPDSSLSTAEKNGLQFEVLTDKGNVYASKLGISWKMPDYMRETFGKMGHDLIKTNGDDTFTVPVPTTILVDKKGQIRNVFVDPDYTQRLEPTTALEWAKAL